MQWADHVRAIRADPEPDAPRLVCADWLLDRGDVRGEYIVLACRLEHVRHGTAEYEKLAARRDELARAHGQRWLEPVTALGAQGLRRDDSPHFSRGFVEHVTLVGRTSTSFAAICTHEPILAVTFISCGPRNYQAIAAMPELAQVRYLSLRGDHMLGCEALVASPHLTGVRRISLPSSNADMLAALAAGAARPCEFSLGGDVPSMRRLVDANFFVRMESLAIMGLGDEAANVLAGAQLPALRSLDLFHANLTPAGLDALGPHLARLDELEVNGGAPVPGVIAALTRHLSDGKLRSLTLANFTSDELVDLVASPAISNVEELHLVYGAFTKELGDALRASPFRSKLRFLRIRVGNGKQPTGYTLDSVTVDDHDEPT